MKLPFLRRKPKPEDYIMKLGPGSADYLTLSQCYSNIFIAGMIGSGKTTGVGANLALGLLSHPSRPGALILCQKPDEGVRFVEYAKKTGRSGDVIHVTPHGRHKIDVLGYELDAKGGGVESAKRLLDVLLEVANRNKSRTSADSYWPESSNRQMGYGMTLIRMAGLCCGLRELLAFCQSLPANALQLKDPSWCRESYAVNCMMGAADEHADEIAFQMAGEWLTNEWPNLNEKTKSIIQSVTINTLDRLLSSEFADLISEDTNWTPEQVMSEGRLLIFDIPAAVYGPAAQLASIAVKLLFQRACLRRDLSVEFRPLIIWSDEAANFCVPDGDAIFLSQSRQFKAINVNIIQNIPLVITALGATEAAKHQTSAWLSNHTTIIGCSNSDPDTNKLLSSLAGEEKQLFFGGSTGSQQQCDLVDDFMGRSTAHVNASWNEQIRPALPPEWFGHLIRGGKENNYVATSYCFQSGRTFSNGRNWILGSFRQRF